MTNNISFYGRTDMGLVRPNNEDALLADSQAKFCLVADGMGGAAAGETASQIFVQTTGEIFNGDLFVEMPQERSRVSDFLNFSPDFIYLGREEGDIILNKEFVFSVKDKSDKITDPA